VGARRLVRHSTPCGVQAHACMLTPLPELELELILSQMAQKPMLRGEARIGSVLPRIVPEIWNEV